MKLLLIILFVTTSLYSADIFSTTEVTKENNQVKEIFSSISSYNMVVCDFVQDKYIHKFKRTLTSSGKFIFENELGLSWAIFKPFPSTTVLTKDKMIQKSPNSKPRIMSAGGNNSFLRFSMTIQSIFLGNYDNIFLEYTIYYQKISDDSWRIGLIPKDSILKSVINSFEITGNEFIESFKLNEINGDSVNYIFSNITYPKSLTEEELNVFK